MWKSKLYFGNNLGILHEHVARESVDLICLDPPVNSSATYNVLSKEKGGEESAALAGIGAVRPRALRLRAPRVRRAYWRGLLALCLFLPLIAMSSVVFAAPRRAAAATDLSRAVIRTVLQKYPQPEQFGPWGYQQGFYLYGQYLVYQRTHDRRYLNYIQGWVNQFVDERGVLKPEINSLDSMQAGNLLLFLYRETHDPRYKTAAAAIWNRLKTYPRTRDGGLWHATTLRHQLWLDGTYMALPFIVRYGAMFGERAKADHEAARQLLIYARHLNDPRTGLMFHAYDESGTEPWASPKTRHSSQFWCRSIGWYGMALIDVLQALPRNDPQRPKLIRQVRRLVKAFAKYQDKKSGLWYEVVNRGDLPDNWLETSGSSMYTYTVAKAVELGYVPPKYLRVALKGYRGVLARVTLNPDGTVSIPDICEGTGVGDDLAYYLSRKRETNDLHGLGAFLVMNETLRKIAHPRP